MTDVTDHTATPTADPAVGAEAGSQPSNTTSAPGASESRSMPDEAYKGLQRRIDRQQQENAALRQQIDELRTKPNTAANEQAVLRLLRALHEKDPAAAMVMAQEIRTQTLESENQTYRTQDETRRQREEIEAVERRNMNELREIAKSLGANPDSPMIDYGDETMYLHERMARVRETSAQAKAPVEPVATPTRTPAQTHNVQPGVPPTVRSAEQPVTETEYQVALAEYRSKPSRAKAEKLDTLRQKLMTQQLANLEQ